MTLLRAPALLNTWLPFQHGYVLFILTQARRRFFSALMLPSVPAFHPAASSKLSSLATIRSFHGSIHINTIFSHNYLSFLYLLPSLVWPLFLETKKRNAKGYHFLTLFSFPCSSVFFFVQNLHNNWLLHLAAYFPGPYGRIRIYLLFLTLQHLSSLLFEC